MAQQVFSREGDEIYVPRLGGIGQVVGEYIEQQGFETRVTVLGHLQRGGTPTPFDRWLATRYGAAAVRLAAQGKFDRMVALHAGKIMDFPWRKPLQFPSVSMSMMMPSSLPAAWAFRLGMNRPLRRPAQIRTVRLITIRFDFGFGEVQAAVRVKPQCRPFGRHWWGAVASFLLIEEGCHSAGFITTIHLRHHLLLSIGWRFNLFAPE